MSGKLIMVVDDDRDIRESLADVLIDEGYAVVGAANGKEALEKIAAGPAPSMLLLDLMMPVMDGYEFYRHWAADPGIKKIPLLIVTAGRVNPEQGSLAEATQLLTKPLDLEKLLALLSQHTA